jgi:hypothetical protein
VCVGSESDRLLSFLVLLSADLFFFFLISYGLLQAPSLHCSPTAQEKTYTGRKAERESSFLGALLGHVFCFSIFSFPLFLSFSLSVGVCVCACVCRHNMDVLTEESFQLHSIQLCDAGSSNDALEHLTRPPTASLSLSLLPSTQVVLEVGGGDERTAPPLRYRCPAFIAQRGSLTLRDFLEDSLEAATQATGGDDTAAPITTTTNSTNITAAAEETKRRRPCSPALHRAPIVVPLPFIDPPVFEVVATYLEHFYGLHSWSGASAANVMSSLSTSSGANSGDLVGECTRMSTSPPSTLRRPLNFADLYALSSWEHHFVLYRLLGLTWGQLSSLRLATDGRWVDLVGGAVDSSGSGSPTSSSSSLPDAAELFTMSKRQQMWTRLTAVLEAATRLGVVPLQRLCATVAANMLLDLDEGGLAQLMSGVGSVVPPFTPKARASLLEQFPWLRSRDQKNPSSAAVK